MNEEQYYIIEQYLNGELKADELRSFEQQLKTDASLAESLRIYQMLNTEMPSLLAQQTNAAEFKKILQQSSAKYFGKEEAKIVSFSSYKKYWFAAAASLIIIITSVLLRQDKNHDELELYAQYASHETISLVSRDSDSQRVLADATNYYNAGDFAAAIPFLESALLKDSSNIKYQITLSRCYTETGAYEKAFSFLNTISAGESVYKYEAVWLKALALLKQKKNEDCISLLKSIPQQADNYAKAQELLTQLK